MNSKIFKSLFFIFQVAIVILEAIGFFIAIHNNGWAIMGYYTQDSNLVMMVAALVYVVYTLTHRGQDMPKWLNTFLYVAICMVTVTFVTVVLVLIPWYSMYWDGAAHWLLLGGSNLYHHLICPILAMVAFLIFDRTYRPNVKSALLAASPTLLYAIVSTSLNVAKVVKGPYPFLYVYEQPLWMSVIWFIAIPTGAFLFALLFGFIKRLIIGKAA